jgi:hypothetical protein
MGLGFGPPSGHRSAAPSSTRGGELALRPEGAALPVFDDCILGATSGRCRTRSAAQKVVVAGHHTGRIRSKDVSLKRVARNGADVAGPFSLSIYCCSRCRRMGCLLWRSCAARLRGSYGRRAERAVLADSGRARRLSVPSRQSPIEPRLARLRALVIDRQLHIAIWVRPVVDGTYTRLSNVSHH